MVIVPINSNKRPPIKNVSPAQHPADFDCSATRCLREVMGNIALKVTFEVK